MFRHLKLAEQFAREKQTARKMQSNAAKARSDIDYIAMMTDIDLDEEDEND